VALGAPDVAARRLKKTASTVQQVELGALAEGGDPGGEAEAGAAWQQQQQQHRQADKRQKPGASRLGSPEPAAKQHNGSALGDAEPGSFPKRSPDSLYQDDSAAVVSVELEDEQAVLLTPASLPSAPTTLAIRAGSVAALLKAAAGAIGEGWRAMLEGWRYVRARENGDVAALVCMKCCAALVWGAIDVLNVRFSEQPSMQLGDSSTTLGFIFAVVGLGCFLGPLAMNRLVPPWAPALRWGVAASYALFFLGLTLMLAAPNLALLLASTLVRSAGSATLWVYSTLLMQQRVPNQLLGRMSGEQGPADTSARGNCDPACLPPLGCLPNAPRQLLLL
jgi:hypothetical protein